jgi:hypothetical protein
MISTPEERLRRVEQELDSLIDADKDALRQHGVSSELEPISDWYCHRGDPLRWLRCCRRFSWKLDRPKEWMRAEVFLIYEAKECEGSEKIAVWTSAELFRPGRPSCANYNLNETIPLDEIVKTGLGAFIRERMRRCQVAIDAASES